MLWVGLATLIMLITGAGDDTRAFRQRVKRMDRATEQVVQDETRRARARASLDRTLQAFDAHRRRLDVMGKCVAQADAKYHVTRAEYEDCIRDLNDVWERAIADFAKLEHQFRSSITEDELSQIQREVAGK